MEFAVQQLKVLAAWCESQVNFYNVRAFRSRDIAALDGLLLRVHIVA